MVETKMIETVKGKVGPIKVRTASPVGKGAKWCKQKDARPVTKETCWGRNLRESTPEGKGKVPSRTNP
jgi:hypothetical protein